MSDPKLPEPSNEFLSSARRGTYTKAQEVQVKNFKMRIQQSRTMHALETVKRDITQSAIRSNFQAIGELKAAANQRATDNGFKGGGGYWWN